MNVRSVRTSFVALAEEDGRNYEEYFVETQ